jgi:hypothetical protein
MHLLTSFKEWLQNRRDSRAKHLPDDYADIVTLHRKGIVRAKGNGQSITDIRAEITSRVRVPIKVVVPHGTYFVSTGSHQNMVTRREYRFELDPLETEHIRVPASCINANLPIPKDSDGFLGVSRVSANLTRFLQAAEGEDAMTVQAGVWAITDGYTGSQVQQHLRRRSSRGFGGLNIPSMSRYMPDEGSAVSDYNIRRAREILKQLKIRTNL